jgi:predicted transglutaminase-like cysteine proteinase
VLKPADASDRGVIMGIGAGARVFARVLSIALALAAAPDRAEAVSEAAGARIAAPPSPPAPVSRVEPFAWAGPVAPASLADAERWRAVAQAVATDRAMLANCRLDSGRCPPAARRLLDIVEAARAKEGRARLGEVNRAVNLAIAYASDLLRYAMPDVWSAPLATFASGRGDCEDYAIAKYLTLLELGVPPQDLRFVVVETRLRGHHAILAVRLDERWFVLDNARFVMAEDRDLSSYRAVAVLGGEDEAAPAALAATIAAGASPADAAAIGEAGEPS